MCMSSHKPSVTYSSLPYFAGHSGHFSCNIYLMLLNHVQTARALHCLANDRSGLLATTPATCLSWALAICKLLVLFTARRRTHPAFLPMQHEVMGFWMVPGRRAMERSRDPAPAGGPGALWRQLGPDLGACWQSLTGFFFCVHAFCCSTPFNICKRDMFLLGFK